MINFTFENYPFWNSGQVKNYLNHDIDEKKHNELSSLSYESLQDINFSIRNLYSKKAYFS